MPFDLTPPRVFRVTKAVAPELRRLASADEVRRQLSNLMAVSLPEHIDVTETEVDPGRTGQPLIRLEAHVVAMTQAEYEEIVKRAYYSGLHDAQMEPGHELFWRFRAGALP